MRKLPKIVFRQWHTCFGEVIKIEPRFGFSTLTFTALHGLRDITSYRYVLAILMHTIGIEFLEKLMEYRTLRYLEAKPDRSKGGPSFP
jgi:hypothetical protein